VAYTSRHIWPPAVRQWFVDEEANARLAYDLVLTGGVIVEAAAGKRIPSTSSLKMSTLLPPWRWRRLGRDAESSSTAGSPRPVLSTCAPSRTLPSRPRQRPRVRSLVATTTVVGLLQPVSCRPKRLEVFRPTLPVSGGRLPDNWRSLHGYARAIEGSRPAITTARQVGDGEVRTRGMSLAR
jgi:hypothetical protein